MRTAISNQRSAAWTVRARLLLPTLLLLAPAFLGCPRPDTPPGGSVSTVAYEELPVEARYVALGEIGQVYRLQAAGPVEARFPVPADAGKRLLADTVRLFRFDESRDTWAEVAESRFDPQAGVVLGEDLEPGLYTAFGWSANPAENVLQRLILDAQRGYADGKGDPASLDGLRQELAGLGPADQWRRVLDWMQVNFTYEITTCETLAGGECHEDCGRHRTMLNSCPTECPEPECCDCRTGTVTERVRVPEDLLEPRLRPCERFPGRFCPMCPYGLSCPDGPFVDDPSIHPTLQVPDYAVMERVGLGPIVEDFELRDVLHSVVERVTGEQYPVPPPWP